MNCPSLLLVVCESLESSDSRSSTARDEERLKEGMKHEMGINLLHQLLQFIHDDDDERERKFMKSRLDPSLRK